MNNRKTEKVVVLGATRNPERYSYKALIMLADHGHNVFPVNPAFDEIEGHKVFNDLSDINENIDTLTMYLSEKRSTPLIEKIVNLKPGRVILNPGTESEELESALRNAGISYEYACTLVLLQTNQF
ncbi:MAG: CoA-binding protein [Gammaproteobacteria bacterium]|nr:MAG: CoA-binding protein [Gammaproteobacteria bacterium]